MRFSQKLVAELFQPFWTAWRAGTGERRLPPTQGYDANSPSRGGRGKKKATRF